MAGHGEADAATAHARPLSSACGLLMTASMTVGRGAVARLMAELAGLTAEDRVVDIGCGPGAAARAAARLGASVTGVDPARAALRLGRRLTAIRRIPNVTFVMGTAEALPLPDSSATVVWAISSLHHWADRTAGLAEISRVLGPGGRVLLAERLVRAGARGHAGHGISRDGAERLASELTAAGFLVVHAEVHRARRRVLMVVQGARPAAPG